MTEKTITCIECPMGCEVTATIEGETVVSVAGNGCQRGKAYAFSEAICPVRIITSTVRTEKGTVIPVKTDAPVKRTEIFNVMAKINGVVCKLPVRAGDVIYKNISDGANLIATASED